MKHHRLWVALFTLLVLPACGSAARAQEPSTEQQISTAVSPLPEQWREGAAVLGYRGGEFVSLRGSTNVMICLADNPDQSGFHAACYHKDLEPFMARGRALRAAGHETAAVDSLREAEIEAGTLAMPRDPRALYSLSSRQEYDAATGAVPDGRRLYVIYMPFATEASTGISATPAGDRPWLMDAGRPWAHVMISK